MTDPKPTFARLDLSDDSAIVGFVARQLQEKQQRRGHFERQAQMNIAWYMGHQELFWDGRSQSLTRPRNAGRRPKLVYNLILPYADQQVASLGVDQVNYEVWPATDDQQDYLTAETSTDLLRYYQDVLDWPAIEEEVDLWSVLTGEGYAKVIWDPHKGSEFDLGELFQSREKVDRYRRRNGSALYRIGDLEVYNVSSMQIFWGAAGRRFDDADWVLELNERTVEELCEAYDLQPDDIPAGDDSLQLYRPDDIGPGGARNLQRDPDVRLVSELWLKRSAERPRGGHYVICGNKLLRGGENPYEHGRIPYVQFRMAVVPGRTYAESYVTQLLGPQSDVNRNMSQQVEVRETMANPYILAKQGSILDWAQWNGRPGGLREYTGEPPQVVPGQGVPSSTIIGLKQTEQYMQDIIGAHDVSRAKTPSGIKSGVAIGLLQEKDEQRLARVRRRRAQGWQRVGQMMLQTLAQYVTEERLVKITSEEDRFRARRFLGSDLRGKNQGPGVNYFDVRVSTSGMPMSRTTQISMVEMLLQYKALDPANPQHRKIIFEALQVGQIKRSVDPQRADQNNQAWENDEMMAGRFIAPRSFDDHRTHLDELNEFRKRGFFRYAPVEIQTLFEIHERKHLELMARQAMLPGEIMQAVQAQRQADGTAPAPMIAAPGAAPLQDGQTGGEAPPNASQPQQETL